MRRAGGDVVLTARCGDDAERFAVVLAEAAAVADLVVTSGGVSQGAYEVVRTSSAGCVVGRDVPLRRDAAGRAAGFGTVDGVPVLTFPGNPVSAQVSFAMFLREPLERAAGLPGAERVRTAVLAEPLTSPAGKRQLLRGATGPGARCASSGSGLPPRRVDGARGRARGRPGRRDRVGRRDRGGGAEL